MDVNGSAGRMQSLELNRLFSLMDGIQADDLFSGMADQLPSIVLPPLPQPGAGCGMEHPSASVGMPNGSAAGANAFAGVVRGELDDEGEGQTSGGSAAPVPTQPADKPLPSKGLYRIHQPPVIERGTCTKVRWRQGCAAAQ